MIPGYSIRHLNVQPGLVLAPMSGVTCSPFRRLIRELNPGTVGLVISEFISVEGMTRMGPRSLAMMKYAQMERPLGIQIFGYDIDRMRDAARMVEDSGVELIDINCGCPAPKVVRRGGGCELMRQPDHAAKIFRAVRAAVKIPLTMKMRSGWDESSKNALEMARIAESEGVEAVTIHGRTRAQLYRGEADWSVAQNVATAVRIPVLGSGDVIDRSSAEERLAYGVKGLFIGRGAIANPFVFNEIVSGCPDPRRKDKGAILAVLERYIELLLEDFPPKACVGKIKQLASQMCRGFSFRKEILLTNTFEGITDVLKRERDEPSTTRLGLELNNEHSDLRL